MIKAGSQAYLVEEIPFMRGYAFQARAEPIVVVAIEDDWASYESGYWTAPGRQWSREWFEGASPAIAKCGVWLLRETKKDADVLAEQLKQWGEIEAGG